MAKVFQILSYLNPYRSVRSHISSATGVVVVTLSLGLSYWAGETSRAQIEEAEGHAFENHATHAVEVLDRSMFERFRDMQVVSSLSDIKAPNVSINQKRKVLEKIQTSMNAYAWIGMCDASGIGIVGTGKYLEGKVLSHRPWCVEGRTGPYVGDVHDALLLAKILPNPSGEEFYLLDVAAPVHKPDGSLLGVVCGHIYWSWAEEMLASGNVEEVDVLLLSRDGVVLAGPETARSNIDDLSPEVAKEIQKKDSGYILETWGNGHTYLTGFAKGKGYRDYPGLGWVTLYRQDVSLAFAPAKALQTRILVFGSMLGLFFVVIGWWQAGRIARPIESITSEVKNIDPSAFSYKAPVIKGEDEVAQLAKEIQRMVSALNYEMSERRYAEQELQKISRAVEQAGEAVIITDTKGVIEYTNPAAAEITGYLIEELIGKPVSILKSDKQDTTFYKDLWGTILSGNVWNGTLIDKRKDGIDYPALMSIAPIRSERQEITHFVAIQQDMTEHRKLEEQLLQAQKLEAVGSLVAGIAHDFNNMLAGINGNLYLAKRKLRGQSEVVDKIDSAERLANKSADMIAQLMTFTRKTMVEKSLMDLSSFVQEITALNHAAIRENIAIDYHIERTPLTILGNSNQIQQVVLNLLVNAQHALEATKHPVIHMSLERFNADSAFVKQHPEATMGDYAHLVVKDNGSGISADNLTHIMEPFFTTKGKGKGTGLGLSMVYEATQNHNGIVYIESELGVGTSVHLYLPLRQANQGAQLDVKTFESTLGKGELILLVDDEEQLQKINKEALEDLGYRVLCAQNGRKAIQVFKENKNEIALVISDVVMPVLGGVKAAEEIRTLHPDIPIIFVTGYDEDELLNPPVSLSDVKVVSKPVAIALLSQKIREVLD